MDLVVDIEANRIAHELSAVHGRNALSYSERMLQEAVRVEDAEAIDIWAAVVAHLKPRSQSVPE